jgi:flavoprotein
LFETIIPNGKTIKIRVRKEEAEQTRKLEQMDGMYTIESPDKIKAVFDERLGKP